MSTLDVQGSIGFGAEARLQVSGSIVAGGDRAFLNVVGRVWPNKPDAYVLVRGSVGAPPPDAYAAPIRAHRYARPDGPQGLVAWSYSKTLGRAPSQSTRAAGAPPVEVQPLFEWEYHDFVGVEVAPKQVRFIDDVNAQPQIGEFTGQGTFYEESTSGIAVELDHELSELVPQPPDPAEFEGGEDPCVQAQFYVDELPTRFEVAVEACAEAGLVLEWDKEAATPPKAGKVYYGFSTEDRTLRDVLEELVLNSGCPWWIEGGVLTIDGRSPLDANGAIGFNYDADTLLTGQVSWRGVTPDVPDEPVLGEYLAQCNGYDGTDPDIDQNFETMTDGTLGPYTIPGAGAGDDYTEVEIYKEKVGGNVTYEREVEYGWRRIGSSIDANGYYMMWGRTARTEVHKTFHPFCTDAQLTANETRWRWPSFTAIEGAPQQPLPPDAPIWQSGDAVRWWDAMPKPYLDSATDVRYDWNPEGWVQSRLETRRVHKGFAFIRTPTQFSQYDFNYEVIPLYETEHRQETFEPLGKGKWSVHVAETFTESKVVLSNPDPDLPDDIEESRVETSKTTHSYRIETDQAPPQVTCSNDCENVNDCEARATSRFNYDHDTWDAQVVNTRPRVEVTAEFEHFLPKVFPLGYYQWKDTNVDAIITSVEHTWDDGSPARTTLTYFTIDETP